MPMPSLPDWATGGGADIDEPPAATKSTGWIAGIRPPHEWVNWFWNLAYQWFDWLDTAPVMFVDPEVAYPELVDGQEAFVWSDELEVGGAALAAANVGAGTVDDLDGDGVYLYYTVTGAGHRIARDLTGGSLVTYTPTMGGVVRAIATDGSVVVLAYDDYVEAFEPATGASRWVYDHTASVTDVCVYTGRVYLVGLAGVGSDELVCRNATSGAFLWGYQHNGNLVAVAAASHRVFIAGAASGFGSAATIRAINYLTGADVANEGGNGVDPLGYAWDAVQAVRQTEKHTLACDSKLLYCGLPAGAAVQVESRGISDGAVIATRTLPGPCVGISVDQSMVLAATESGADGLAIGLEKTTLAAMWQTPPYATDLAAAAFTDGAGAFVGVTGAATNALYRVFRGNDGPRIWRRHDYATVDTRTPWRRLIYPVEA